MKIILPDWFDEIADQLFVGDLRVRRYYPAFVEACRTICLIRSFQPDHSACKHGRLEVDFADFAITALIFDTVFVESLHLGKGSAENTRRLVDEISKRKGKPVDAHDFARVAKIPTHKAYSQLRYAVQRGVIKKANRSEKGNRKLYLPADAARFVPDPEKLFQKLECLGDKIRFEHPITGEEVVYRRRK